MVVHLILLGLVFGALALAIGDAGAPRPLVYGITAAIGVLTYLANGLAPQVDALAWLQKLSPFYYYSGHAPLRHGLQIGDATVLLAATAVFVAVSISAFNRRDVRA